ncbi:di-trans,poly-cis-decaprenylcistransferase [Halorhabdus sp. CBA1104]|uniref:polyprenyl diphosphate synthase n=1 Tax=Halorhabdus sp. CBA1104 TaxID=1380432 RepID=UPI0012B19255|nr:polyprenyl diphosphate synthase [Halorhabdus sp. CBA1104]QGN06717.1 di-trans,poly-cis-decaprenylcistransferase [Halorhabdus sp. CBA1104]
MVSVVRQWASKLYEQLLEREVSGAPDHVAVIQDGNRRYARAHGEETSNGHRAGAQTTESLLEWCDDLGVAELTLYAFSTENFNRPADQRAVLFDLIEDKLYEFADHDRVHEAQVRIRAIGELDRLPERVREAVAYADRQTRGYDQFHLNIALAYGGRAELLGATRSIAEDIENGCLDPTDIDAGTIEDRLYDGPTSDVDLIVRTGGDERTSNFLPWHANGNEAAVYFCAPYWPEFRKIDFLRAIRTYEHRAESWRQTRARRALALLRAVGSAELSEAKGIVRRFRDTLPSRELEDVDLSSESDPEPQAD